jgi:hypothetical protein
MTTTDLSDRHPSVQAVMRHFSYGHLPPPLREVSRRFHELAWDVVGAVPDDPQLTLALQLLLQSKDAAVRAANDAKATGLG